MLFPSLVAGSQILRQAVSDPSISAITILSRRALPEWIEKAIPSNKTSSIVLEDFSQYPPDLSDVLVSHDACIWALGCSSVGMTEDAYEKITYGYVDAFISALRDGGVAAAREGKDPFRFLFVSASGAEKEDQSPQMFGRVKVCYLFTLLSF